METIKFDRARKQLRIDGAKVKGQELDYFVQQNTFDKDQSTFINHKGLTYVIENPASQEDEEIFFPINLQYQGTPEQARLLAMKSEKELDEIIAIKEEYGLLD